MGCDRSFGPDAARQRAPVSWRKSPGSVSVRMVYSYGSSEEILGRALKDFANRDDVVIATKLRHPMRPGPNGKGLSRKAIMAEVDHSLRRLGTDYIDLYQIHRNDPTTPLAETLEALHDLVKAGKVRYLGASSMHAWEFAKVLHLQTQHGWARFAATDGAYADLLYTPAEEAANKAVIDAVGTIAAERDVSRPGWHWPGCTAGPWSPRRWPGPTRPPRSTTPSHRWTSS